MAKVYPITRLKNSVRDDSPVIAIGGSRYYLSNLFNKHLHAGQDVEVFTSFGDRKTIKKGEWIGNLFSYVVVLGKPALMFKPSGNYFGAKNYYMPYYGVNTIDDNLLRYNYKNKWMSVPLVALIIQSLPLGLSILTYYNFPNDLPNVEQSDKKADDTDKKIDDLDKRDAAIDDFLNQFKKPIYLGAAALATYKALSANKPAEQAIFGGLAAYAAYEGLKDVKKKALNTEGVTGYVAGIGKVRFKSQFVPIYKNQAVPELGWKAETNIKWAQGKAGVYIIKRNNKVVYVGASGNVYRKSLRHFEPYKPDKPGSKQDYFTDYEQNDYKIRIVVTNTVKQAYKLEAALIQKLRPRDNYVMEPHLDFTQREVDAALDEYDFVEVEAPF
jgi:GIY-YIG catalytic domain